jgi:predicted O-methyltransferase YrrM
MVTMVCGTKEPRMLTDAALTLELRAAAAYAEASARFNAIEGYLHPLEGFALARLAAAGEGVGEIVEIGSFMGRSTAWLAWGAASTGRERVTAIDHFMGSPEHQKGQPWECKDVVESGSTLARFRTNIEKAGVAGHVDAIVAPSLQARRSWTKPIRLLFIDGDHSYDASRADFEAWSPLVVHRGCIALHDVGAWEGVTKFFQELSGTPGAFRTIAAVNSLRILQRVAPVESGAVRRSA